MIPMSLLDSVSTTFEVGCASSTTVNVSVPPAFISFYRPIEFIDRESGNVVVCI